MKKVFFSAAMSLLLLAGFSSCKNDDPEPPKPPVVEDVLGSYSAENLALTVTGGTPGANPEVVLLQSDGKTKVRLTNVVPNNEDFTINDVTYSAVETKAYVSQISGTETSDLAGYTVEFAGTVDAEGKLTATVKLTEIPAAPIEDVASLQSTYKGQLVVNVNGNAFPGMEQRVYLDKGSKYTSNKSLAKLTIKNLSILDMEISQIQLNNLVVSQRGSVALIDSVGYAYNLPAPLSMKALIDVTGTIVDKTITLSLKIALVDDASMQIGVGFSGTAVTENMTAKLESLSVESPAIVKNFDPAKPSSTNTFTVLSNAKAEDLQIAPKATLGEGCTFASIETNIGGQTAEIKEGDKIAVCISGGKDSMLMAKLFQELQRHNRFPFEVTFLVMDPGYSKENRQIIENNAKKLHIPLTIFESDIFEAVLHVEKSPCYLCARMRRGHLYAKAKELGCNKIALGHHYDDVIETILMGMLYGAQVQTMMPKLHSTNFEGMELIRPLYLVREDDIKKWRDYNDLHFLQCACKFTETCSIEGGDSSSKRMEIKHLIRDLKKTNPFVEGNIFKSVENVNLSTVIAYKQNGVKHHFLESYDDVAESRDVKQ